jgi:hypothetical protein
MPVPADGAEIKSKALCPFVIAIVDTSPVNDFVDVESPPESTNSQRLQLAACKRFKTKRLKFTDFNQLQQHAKSGLRPGGGGLGRKN